MDVASWNLILEGNWSEMLVTYCKNNNNNKTILNRLVISTHNTEVMWLCMKEKLWTDTTWRAHTSHSLVKTKVDYSQPRFSCVRSYGEPWRVMGQLLRQNSPCSDLLECRTVLDITNTPPVSIKYGIKVHIKDLLGFNRGHERAALLCVICVSLLSHWMRQEGLSHHMTSALWSLTLTQVLL